MARVWNSGSPQHAVARSRALRGLQPIHFRAGDPETPEDLSVVPCVAGGDYVKDPGGSVTSTRRDRVTCQQCLEWMHA